MVALGNGARLLALSALLLGIVVSGCGGSSSGAGTTSRAGDPATDKLAQILARGTLVMATDPAYPPQSYRVKGAQRPANTRCAANQLTGNQMAGYDADTSKLVAKALGVEPCFVAPTWTEIISGHWDDRWDIAIASVGINRERSANLYWTHPYSAEAERFFVRKDSRFTRVGQLSGKRLGGCGGCFAQEYIQRSLQIPGQPVTYLVNHATFVGYDVEANGLAAVAKHKLAAFLCGVAVGAKAIKSGLPLRELGGDQYVAYLSGVVDRSSGYHVASFVNRVDAIVAGLLRSGTLRRLSLHYFHTDFATGASSFDTSSLGQHVR
jgi:polar amino acid transport system substrate-binding protein